MPTAPVFPTIPVPTADPEALLQTVIALKQAVDMLTGVDGEQKFAAHVFLDREPPVAYHVGDIWLYEGERFSLNIWNGFRWLRMVDVAPPVELMENPDFLLDIFRRKHR